MHQSVTIKLLLHKDSVTRRKLPVISFEFYVIKHTCNIRLIHELFSNFALNWRNPILHTENKRRYVFCLSEQSVGNLFHNRQEKVIIVSTSLGVELLFPHLSI